MTGYIKNSIVIKCNIMYNVPQIIKIVNAEADMADTKACEWLIENGGITTRYRVFRELLQDETEAKKIEDELLSADVVMKWLKLLKPETPPQHRSMAHGSFDFCFENAMPRLTQLGLHAGFEQVRDAVCYYTDLIKKYMKQADEEGSLYRHSTYGFFLILAVGFLVDAGFRDDYLIDFMLRSLDEAYRFAKLKSYDLYISDDERRRLPGVPRNWVNAKFLKPELFDHGYCFPLIYDIIGMHTLYELKDPEIDDKLNEVISYISSDDFHSKISDGYGIIIETDDRHGRAAYHGMGWDPKYPGWFNVREYIEKETISVSRFTYAIPRLLYYAQTYAKYPGARETKWFKELLKYLDTYKTEKDTYLFPASWLKEASGYAVGGNHLSFGENRRKKNWSEIESTLYMQLLKK